MSNFMNNSVTRYLQRCLQVLTVSKGRPAWAICCKNVSYESLQYRNKQRCNRGCANFSDTAERGQTLGAALRAGGCSDAGGRGLRACCRQGQEQHGCQARKQTCRQECGYSRQAGQGGESCHGQGKRLGRWQESSARRSCRAWRCDWRGSSGCAHWAGALVAR